MTGKMSYVQDGRTKQTSYTYFRGERPNFHPTDETLTNPDFISEYLVRGWMPSEPFIDKQAGIVPFGSCFAANIRTYLANRGYRLLNSQGALSYVNWMPEGIVNTFAIRQQFEWAWLNRVPEVELWHGYDSKVFGYVEDVRLATQALFDACDVFIITLGLSEVWYDEPTGEVFWRAVPREYFDASRHKFRVSSVMENYENLAAIHRLIRERRPDATIVFTLSPVPLAATFRPIGCASANTVSKAILRAAVDELMRGPALGDPRCFYFPSYEIVTTCFMNPMMEDRKHPHAHVIDLNMAIFERYFCQSDMTDQKLSDLFRRTQELDYLVARDGHFAVPRREEPNAGGATPRPFPKQMTE